jgi:hypothetical protein
MSYSIGNQALTQILRSKSDRLLDGKQAWQVAYEGTRAGTDFTATFPPVRARYVRLNILDSTRPPTIWEFQVFAK